MLPDAGERTEPGDGAGARIAVTAEGPSCSSSAGRERFVPIDEAGGGGGTFSLPKTVDGKTAYCRGEATTGAEATRERGVPGPEACSAETRREEAIGRCDCGVKPLLAPAREDETDGDGRCEGPAGEGANMLTTLGVTAGTGAGAEAAAAAAGRAGETETKTVAEGFRGDGGARVTGIASAGEGAIGAATGVAAVVAFSSFF